MKNVPAQDREKLLQQAEQLVGNILNQSGRILYTSAATIRKAKLYVIGFNPGGEPNEPSQLSIRESLNKLCLREWSAYDEEEWKQGHAPGCDPYQRGVRWLADWTHCGVDEVLGTNLIFVRSKSAADIQKKYHDLAERCWPVHDWLIKQSKPRIVVAVGNGPRSAYQFIKARYIAQSQREWVAHAGHGRYQLKAFRAELEYGLVPILGVPHLSRYTIESKKEAKRFFEKHSSDLLEEVPRRANYAK